MSANPSTKTLTDARRAHAHTLAAASLLQVSRELGREAVNLLQSARWQSDDATQPLLQTAEDFARATDDNVFRLGQSLNYVTDTTGDKLTAAVRAAGIDQADRACMILDQTRDWSKDATYLLLVKQITNLRYSMSLEIPVADNDETGAFHNELHNLIASASDAYKAGRAALDSTLYAEETK